MDRASKIVAAITIFVVLLVGTLIYVEVSTTTTEEFYATVTSKSFVPSDSGTSVGINPNGGSPVISHWSTSEKWILLFEFNGVLHDNDVKKTLWAQVEKGDEVIIRVPTSYFGEGNPYVVDVTDR